MKILPFMNKLFVLFVTFAFFSSCGEDHALNEETFYFQEEHKAWFTDFEYGDHFVMKDENGISQSFRLSYEDYYFDKSWGGILGFTTHMSHTEYRYQEFVSNFGNSFHVSMRAAWPPFGDLLSMEVNDIYFTYDFSFNVLSHIDTPYGYKWLTMMEDEYDANATIYSKAQFLNNYELNGVVYENVLRFELKDFTESWHETTITEFYVAQRIGLIKFKYNNGLEVYRQ